MVEEQIVDRRFRDQAPLVQDGDTVADAFDVGEDVGREEHRRGITQLPDHLQEIAAALRVQRRNRLVEDQQRRPADQGLADSQALAHAARVASDPATGGGREADPIEGLADASAEVDASQPEKTARQREQLAPGHPVVVPGILVEDADAPPELDIAGGADGDPGDRSRSRVGPGEPGQEPDRGGLAGALGPSSPKIEPAGTTRSSLSTAVTRPNRLTRPVASIAGGARVTRPLSRRRGR